MSKKRGKMIKRSIRMEEDTYESISNLLAEANVRSVTDFINNAVEFYAGYLSSGKSQDYLIKTVSSMMDAKFDLSEDRTDGMLFKLAVEVAMQNRILAKAIRIGEEEIAAIREKAMDDVRRIWR